MPSCAVIGAVSTPGGSAADGLLSAPCPSASSPGFLSVSTLDEAVSAQTRADDMQARLSALEAVSTSSGLPSTADMAEAWGIGFTFVVGCYAIGRSVGVVLNMLR